MLAADHSNVEYGTNLIGMLDYLSPIKPTLEVFRKRKWLILNQHSSDNVIDVAWYHYIGFRTVKHRLDIVGQVEIYDSDPTDSAFYRRWTGIGEQAVQQHQ